MRGQVVMAVAVGALVGVIVTMLLQGVVLIGFPVPAGDSAAAYVDYFQHLPPRVFWLMLLAWFVGSADGAMLAAWWAPDRPWRYAFVCCAVLTLIQGLLLFARPFPIQWQVALLPVHMLAWLVGGKVGCMLHDRRRAGISR